MDLDTESLDHDVGDDEMNEMSPAAPSVDGSTSTTKSKLQLPLSCDPPGPGNPAKQLVWIVSLFLFLLYICMKWMG